MVKFAVKNEEEQEEVLFSLRNTPDGAIDLIAERRGQPRFYVLSLVPGVGIELFGDVPESIGLKSDLEGYVTVKKQ